MGRILIIDAHTDSARLAARLLARVGHRVMLAPDGKTGISLAAVSEPDLIIFAPALREADENTLTREVHAWRTLSGVPFLLCIALQDDMARRFARRAGCVGYLTKPINTRTFADEVERHMRRARPALPRLYGFKLSYSAN
jgi:DNA-binding response OmpR family regulator